MWRPPLLSSYNTLSGCFLFKEAYLQISSGLVHPVTPENNQCGVDQKNAFVKIYSIIVLKMMKVHYCSCHTATKAFEIEK